MVKFGRHVDFFVANELCDSKRRLYVVPYKEVQHRTCIEIPKTAAQPSTQPHPHPPSSPLASSPPSTPEIFQLSREGSSSYAGGRSRDGTPQPARLQHQQQQTTPSGASGLTALFGDGSIPSTNDIPSPPDLTTAGEGTGGQLEQQLGKDAVTENANLQPKNDIVENIDDRLNIDDKLLLSDFHNAVTINAGTGAELATAVKHILIKKGKNHPSTAQMIPDDTTYGFDDTCNSDNGGGGNKIIDSPEVMRSEEEREAEANFFAQRFQTEWRICLKRASSDFERAMGLFWNEVFGGITSYNSSISEEDDDDDEEEKKQANDYEESIRGALPDAALQMYVSVVPPERAHETFSFLKDIHATALINAEALRKLVKKFDKMHYKLDRHSYLLSAKLLPEVYASNFTGSLASLEAGLALLRVLLNMEEDDNSLPDNDLEELGVDSKAILAENKRLGKLAAMDDDLRDVAVLSGGYFGRGSKKETDDKLVEGRMKELQWLRNMVEGIDPVYIPFLVAHRGFHSIHDRSDVRPLENSLMAYEAAWTNGLHLCECDIALTKDERIVLAHDENFARLGMDPASPLCNRTVRDLTFKELLNCPLKSGARPPLLFDVLRSAAAIGGDAKLIVEIKAGNAEAGSALARMFVRHPQLMEHVAVVMSFDAFIMHKLRMEMAAVFEQLHIAQQQHAVAPTANHHPRQSLTAPIQIPVDNADYDPVATVGVTKIALGSTLSSSPHLPNPLMQAHNRAPSHARVPSMLGGHHRLDSRDIFGLGHPMQFDPKADIGGGGSIGLGLNLADIDNTTSRSSTFLPIPKILNSLQPQPQQDEEKRAEQKEDPFSQPPVVANNQIKSFPKLLLITVAQTPKAGYEQFVDITKPDTVAELDGWLRGGDGGTLDGVYMQYQKAMLMPEGSKTMRNLASRYDVGIWGANPVPDDWETFHTLVTECHVSYVNSSLPKHFRRKMKRSMSANSLAMNAILESKNIRDIAFRSEHGRR